MRELLYQALSSPLGIAVQCDNVELLKQRLYKERREAMDPALLSLTLSSPIAGELWIIRRAQETPPADEVLSG